MKSPTLRIAVLAAICLPIAALAAIACSTIEVPRATGAPPRDAKNTFSHAEFDGVLKKFVNKVGRVDYGGLRLDHTQLDKYLGQLRQTSPDNDKSLFPNRWHQMAYWVNAYNACVLKQVIDENITESVGDTKFREVAFFKTTSFLIGETSMNLYNIQDRARALGDARVHFIMNCGANGAPRLRQESYNGESLDKVMEEAGIEFCNSDLQISINKKTDDNPDGSVTFSAILHWHSSDFIEYARGRGVAGATLRDAVNLWRAKEARIPLNGTDINNNFDWTLNKQEVKSPQAK
ncbi:MAG: DUF547 domain-containing protein [Planctomycetota bacterium]